jgi:hypothetical protein
MKYEYDFMLDIAKKIIKRNPDYILCGSLGLILLGVLPERLVGDIDFICPKNKFNTSLETYGGYGPLDNGGYLCYKITQDGGYYYNVFVFDDPKFTMTIEKQGLQVQIPEQMLYFKSKYARKQDLEDIKKISPEYLL